MRSTFAFLEKYQSILHLVVLCISFFLVYYSVFDEKLHLSGDNTTYYILGKSLDDGEGYSNIHHLEKDSHFHYPPGYPVMIALVMQIAQNSIIAIKIFNGIIYLLSLVCFYYIIRHLNKHKTIAFITCLVLVFNFHLLGYSTIMMSEIPFLFFSVLSIWIFLKLKLNKSLTKNTRFFIVLLLVVACIYIRSVAVGLILSMVFSLILRKKIGYAITLLTGSIALYIPWVIRGLDFKGNTYLQQVMLKNPYQPELGPLELGDLFQRIGVNMVRYITTEIPSILYFTENQIYTDNSYSFMQWATGILVLIVIGFGVIKQQNRLSIILIYILMSMGILMIWPEIWYGTRFLIPLIPFLVYFFIYGLYILLSALTKIIFKSKTGIFKPLIIGAGLIAWGICYAKPSVENLHQQANGNYANNYANYLSLAKWLKENGEKEVVVAVRKEGLFYLHSDTFVIEFKKTPDLEEQIEFLKRKQVKYLVLDQLGFSSTYNYLYPAIERYPNKFETHIELKDPNTYLFKFKPELGYWGDWENNKRKGFGTYTWSDGQHFEGYWENDVRHGKGTVTFNNGETLSGNWTNGMLNDTVVKRSAKGKIIEISLYQNNVKTKVIDAQP